MKKGWPTRTLGGVCQFRGGGTPSKTVEQYWCGDIPWVSPKDMKFDVVSDSIDHISQEAIDGSATSLIPKDSVLIVVRSGILARTVPIAITGRDLTINQDLKALCPNGAIDARFLYHLLESKMDLLLSMVSRGATVHRLMTEQIRSLDFILPPLPEQQRIVSILDEAFVSIATAKANAGKNLQNARALFESYLQAVFSQQGEGWVERRLGDVFDIGSSKRIRETEWTSSGVPFYGGKEIVRLAKFGSVISNAYISEEKYRDYASRYDMPRKGDVLITARGTIGVGYIVQEGDKFYYKDGNIISFREKTPTNPLFVLYAFRSEPLIEQFADLTGATVTHLPIERAKNLTLKMPSFITQGAIVERLGNIENEIQRLESIYQRKLTSLDELKKSMLHQAFAGKL
jgi:type I restriction enzyme S subunit